MNQKCALYEEAVCLPLQSVNALLVGCVVMKIFEIFFLFWYKIKIHYFVPNVTRVLKCKTVSETGNILCWCWMLDIYSILLLFSH